MQIRHGVPPSLFLIAPQTEEWRRISDFPSYGISDKGRIIRITPRPQKRNKNYFLKICINGQGYYVVQLQRDRKNHKVELHKLLYKTFLGSIPNGKIIHHKDFDKTNNKLDNFELVSRLQHRSKIHPGKGFPGSQNPSAKLNEDKVSEIRNLYSKGFFTKTELAKYYSISKTTIGRIINGKLWKDSRNN
jgi:hypothetical protein